MPHTTCPAAALTAAIDAFEVTGMPVGGPAPGKPKLQKTGAGEVTPGRNNRRFTFNSAEYGKGVQYDFSVRAHNKAGFGPASTPPVRFTTPTERVPGMPTLSITRLPDGVYLDVTPPANAIGLTYELVGHPDGWETAQRKRIVIRGAGDPVSGQSGTATDTLQGRRGGLAPPNTRRFKLTGYLDNVVYRFAASARTAAGLGPESVPRIVFYECGDGYTDTGSGCVRKCPPITNCKVYSNVDCSCTECNAGNYKCNGQCIPDATCCTVAGAVCPSANSNCKCTAGNSRCPRNGGTCQCKSGYDNCNPNTPDCETNLNTSNQHCGRPKSAVCSKAIGLPMATGYNWDGRLGDGTTTGRDSPVNVANVGSVSKATFLAAGLAHTCVAVNFGAEAAMCWG
ncbi:hypothetical protein COHA_003311 [Chlorella ohadii]|uniref:Fibronectin type-III domain-containing protein n=1 Tax=Chlorella ohadii TaxID=2649997 RepID=A0AAD5H7H3_9CHLO|nr:hypothetical protein COHA_003311 [Chlorella ohadii]